MADETNPTENSSGTESTNETFDAWLGKQDATVKGLITQHTQGLSNTVKAVRGERDALSKQIKDLTAKAADGSETKAELEKLSGKLNEANRRSDFIESANDAGCINTKAAYPLAVAEDYFKRDGSPDWDAIKKAAPELFEKKKLGKVDAGSGKNAPEDEKTGSLMDQLIRGRFGG